MFKRIIFILSVLAGIYFIVSLYSGNSIQNVFSQAIPQIPQIYIEVVKPNGGERLKLGTSYVITWRPSLNFPAENILSSVISIDLLPVKIYIRPGVTSSEPINIYTLTGGPEHFEMPGTERSTQWNIPTSTLEQGEYKIRISATATLATGTPPIATGSDESDNPFFLLAYPQIQRTLRIVSPNGGEKFNQGDKVIITWDYSGQVERKDCRDEICTEIPELGRCRPLCVPIRESRVLSLILLPEKNPEEGGYNIVSTDITAKKHDWTIPAAIPSGRYKVYGLWDVEGAIAVDESDNFFEIGTGTGTGTGTSGMCPSPDLPRYEDWKEELAEGKTGTLDCTPRCRVGEVDARGRKCVGRYNNAACLESCGVYSSYWTTAKKFPKFRIPEDYQRVCPTIHAGDYFWRGGDPKYPDYFKDVRVFYCEDTPLQKQVCNSSGKCFDLRYLIYRRTHYERNDGSKCIGPLRGEGAEVGLSVLRKLYDAGIRKVEIQNETPLTCEECLSQERIVLEEAKRLGFETWINIEPVNRSQREWDIIKDWLQIADHVSLHGIVPDDVRKYDSNLPRWIDDLKVSKIPDWLWQSGKLEISSDGQLCNTEYECEHHLSTELLHEVLKRLDRQPANVTLEFDFFTNGGIERNSWAENEFPEFSDYVSKVCVSCPVDEEEEEEEEIIEEEIPRIPTSTRVEITNVIKMIEQFYQSLQNMIEPLKSILQKIRPLRSR